MRQAEVKRPYNVLTVCQYIAYYCYVKKYELTNLRLQKLLYFIQFFFFLKYDSPCFSNRMEAWDLGPVIPDAYHYYKKYGAKDIPVEQGNTSPLLNKDDQVLIARIIDSLSAYSTFQLVNITHGQAPWRDNYVAYDSHEIKQADLKEFANERRGKS